MGEISRRILVTGANGFIGKNLTLRLRERDGNTVSTFLRGDDSDRLAALVAQADAVIHLAGENRPADEDSFAEVNTGLTVAICHAIKNEYKNSGRHIPLLLASSIQADQNNPYGRSKLAAEEAVESLSLATGNPCVVYRLPGVFGKWCKPNYNSVVATFCHNIARDLPIQINNPETFLQLVYVDDVVSALLASLEAPVPGLKKEKVEPEYSISLDTLAEHILGFKECRTTLMTDRVGQGLIRALYATYVSFLPNESFAYEVSRYVDPRGVFVEMLKTPDCGQFSYFTAHPGITRGGHYHHTKSEKFLVIKGNALFRFRHLVTDELFELKTSGMEAQIVDTIPGWSHDITNIGTDELVVMLWANENFDREKPDTVAHKVK
ncbi:UDP-2-acetamido-2,6-beta-L-arabino-hexul-4-ose reductase [Chromobacterium haemolyticum]|uniref:UDP-2-acetamido-2,6-beta-L-arabino-hexul-4-ose reductase n=1 Tax=Chromobacterium haemolyticum TaxID=394935 RepID=UPI0009DABD8F|nr:NAD-dependent epimerase/dehydratase family protein [Chromobacterium haemolyticum]OQS42517.1 capsular biosynthesis protein [Chromobacterium haemolyticum]